MRKQLEVPKFKNEDEEIKFWSKIDLSEYFQPEDFGRVSLIKGYIKEGLFGTTEYSPA